MTPEAAAAAIRRGRKEIRKLVSAFHHAAAVMVRKARLDGFDAGKAPSGEKWTPLKKATVRRKSGEHATKRQYAEKKGQETETTTRRAKKSASPESPLIDQGYMRMPTIESDHKSGRVILAKSRATPIAKGMSISEIHDKGAGDIPQREHWAIYPAAEKKIIQAWNALKEEIKEDIGL